MQDGFAIEGVHILRLIAKLELKVIRLCLKTVFFFIFSLHYSSSVIIMIVFFLLKFQLYRQEKR